MHKSFHRHSAPQLIRLMCLKHQELHQLNYLLQYRHKFQLQYDYEKPGIERLIQYKKKHIVLTEAETKAFEEKLKPVTEHWIKEVEKEGIDGRKLVNKARKLIKKYEE